MDTYCSKCEVPITPDVGETPVGYLLSCPNCDGPVGFVSYEEAEALDCNEVFSEDEKRYLLHLVNKQIDKLDNAISQLLNIKETLGGFDDSEE